METRREDGPLDSNQKVGKIYSDFGKKIVRLLNITSIPLIRLLRSSEFHSELEEGPSLSRCSPGLL
jgi:hypothetical protein